MEFDVAIYLLLAGGLIALIYARIKTKWIGRQQVDNADLVRIGGYISDGAMAFMRREFNVLVPFVIVVAAFLWLGNPETLRLQSLAFILGAGASGAAGGPERCMAEVQDDAPGMIECRRFVKMVCVWPETRFEGGRH